MQSLRSPYRRFCSKWWGWYLNPATYFRHFREFIQRGRRGWADSDVWGMDGYLCEVVIPMLERLKEDKHGYPCPADAVFDPATGDGTDEEYARWEREWDNRLNEMIAGFKAAQEVIDGPPMRFFPDRLSVVIAAEELEADREAAERKDGCRRWVSPYDYDAEGYAAWMKTTEETRRKGFAAFTECFYSLWD